MGWNQNASYGRSLFDMINSQVPAMGNIFVVVKSTDSMSKIQHLRDMYTGDSDGRVRFFTTIASAYTAMENSNNDVMVIDASGTHGLTEMLTVNKDRCHFFGMDGGGRLLAQGAKISISTTGVATDIATVLVTGVRNTFRNIKFINGSTTNQALYGFIDNGEGTLIENCSFVKTAGLDDAGHAHFWMAGDSLTMRNCVIGQSNTPNTAAGYGILIDGRTGGATDGTVKENFIENCYINMSVGGSVQATSCLIKVADTAALNFGNVMKKVIGTNFIPSGGTIMTNAILAPASIVAGTLFLVDPGLGGSTGVIDNASAGIQIISSGVAPVAAGGLSTNLTD